MRVDDQHGYRIELFLTFSSIAAEDVIRDFKMMETQYALFLERWLEDEKSLPLQDVFIQMDNFINAFKVRD